MATESSSIVSAGSRPSRLRNLLGGPARAGSPGWPFRLVIGVGAVVALVQVGASLPKVDEDRVVGWSAAPVVGRADASRIHRTMRHAHTWGLRPGDVLVGIEGRAAAPEVVAEIREAAAPGDVLSMVVERDGTPIELSVPVAASTPSYRGYLWYRICLGVVAWLLGLALIARRGRSGAALVLGVALLIYLPITLPSGSAASDPVRTLTQIAWHLLGAAHRFLLPALLLHFMALQWPEGSRLRSRRVWVGIYSAVAGVILVITAGLTDLLAWTTPGFYRQLRGAAGLVFEILAFATALALMWRRPRAVPQVRWVAYATLVMTGTGIPLSATLLVAGEHIPEAVWRVNGLMIMLLPIAAAFYLVLGEERPDGWRQRTLLATLASIGIAQLYGIALAGASAVVLSSAGHPLDDVEYMMFAAIVVAAVIFAPLLQWARERVDRRLFRRWVERAARVRAFTERLTAELEPVLIAQRVEREVPTLLPVDTAHLMLADGWLADLKWEPEGLEVRSTRALESEVERLAGSQAEILVPVRAPDGELLAALRLGRSGSSELDDFDRALFHTLAQGLASDLLNARTHIELKEAERELAESERIASLGALAGGLAHAIKNPLAGLKMGLYLLEREGTAPERVSRFRDDVQRIDDLVTGVLRLTHEGAPDEIRPLHVAPIVRRSVGERRPMAEDRGIRLIEAYDTGAESVRALASPDQLRLMISNLLDNALTATPDGGSIEVYVSTGEGEVEFGVRDNGRGMTPEVRAHAFDLSFTTGATGSGLGLALIRREAERLGGVVEVDSVPGEGSDVRIRIPRCPA